MGPGIRPPRLIPCPPARLGGGRGNRPKDGRGERRGRGITRPGWRGWRDREAVSQAAGDASSANADLAVLHDRPQEGRKDGDTPAGRRERTLAPAGGQSPPVLSLFGSSNERETARREAAPCSAKGLEPAWAETPRGSGRRSRLKARPRRGRGCSFPSMRHGGDAKRSCSGRFARASLVGVAVEPSAILHAAPVGAVSPPRNPCRRSLGREGSLFYLLRKIGVVISSGPSLRRYGGARSGPD